MCSVFALSCCSLDGGVLMLVNLWRYVDTTTQEGIKQDSNRRSRGEAPKQGGCLRRPTSFFAYVMYYLSMCHSHQSNGPNELHKVGQNFGPNCAWAAQGTCMSHYFVSTAHERIGLLFMYVLQGGSFAFSFRLDQLYSC